MNTQTVQEILKQLKTTPKGLSTKEAKIRLQKYGANKFPKSGEKMTKLKIFLEQWKSPLILILFVAGIISGFLKEIIDMTVIFITVGVNVIIGFVQEFKANQALQKLDQMIEYKAIVLRDGREVQVISQDIVLGDVMILESGDKIQADGRIIEEKNLEINESVLTGESQPVKKHMRKIAKNVALGDKANMVFRGTVVVNGRAQVIVTSTGKNTEIGRIASLVKTTKDEKTPLQVQLAKMGKVLGLVVVFISIALFLLGIFSSSEHHGFFEMFETTIAVAVAAIPEGLVISMTVILAIGMQRILKKKVLVRKLLAAETLGSVSVICTDKTGTLTEGKMKLTHVVTAHDDLSFDEVDLLNIENEEEHREALLALRIGVLCNDGALENPEEPEGEWKFLGDTTDQAFIQMGMKAGLEKHHLEKAMRRVDEIPFDSKNKFIATLHYIDHESLLYVKGAAEVLYSKCTHYEEDGKTKRMNKKMMDWFQKQEEILTRKGLRVLALAYKNNRGTSKKVGLKDVNNLVLVGLIALSDPLRSDVQETIKLARGAGIRIVMITGDHMLTAKSIGKDLGIPCEDKNVFNGRQLEDISDKELNNLIDDLYIFARVDPKHKIRIVQAFQAKGEVVAMTGDGVNDAPALKGADIGVALGSGTDVAHEVSDMILLDNHFNTIVAAVEEGRRIYQNIKKIVLYLLSNSFTEIVIIGGSIIAGLPLAVLPAQILWVNLIEDTFPNMALAFDKGEKENMNEPPRKRGESVVDKEMKIMISIISIVSSLALFVLFWYFWKTTGDLVLTRTIIFVGLGIDSLLYIYSVRSMRHHFWNMDPFDNKYLTTAVLFGWVMLIGAVYLPSLQTLLRTAPLGWEYWLAMGLFGFLNIALIEIVKGFFLVKRVR